MIRRDKINYYLDLADIVSQRGTCLRKRYGAVIVKNDEVISTGYVGAPRGRANCIDLGYCIREEMHVPRGERYELCRSVHAEANAICQSARNGARIEGATLYVTASPCFNCFKLCASAGISTIVYGEFYRDPRIFEFAQEAGITLRHVDVASLAPTPQEPS